MVTDVDIIKGFAAQWGFKFNLTRKVEDFNNLVDNNFPGYYLFMAEDGLDPVKQSEFTFDDSFKGKIFICTPSDLRGVLIDDQGNYDKYLNVKKCYQIRPWNLLNLYDCPAGYKVEVSNVKPFYNWANINYDGIMFDYRIIFNNAKTELTQQEILNIIANG